MIQLLEPVLKGTLTSVVPTNAATTTYNEKLQARISRSIFVQCASWFRAGTQNNGKVSGVFPEPITMFWWWTRKPVWGNYEVRGPGAENWQKKAINGNPWTVISLGLLAAGVAYVMWRP